MNLKALFLSITLLSGLGCAVKPLAPPTPLPEPAKVSVLTYNVENLFDTNDDPDKNDEEYLPASLKKSETYQNKCRVQASNKRQSEKCISSDWSPARLDRKLSRLTDVIEQINQGFGPDILIVEETESLDVLNLWREKYMSKMGYQTLAYVKGPDERGINPAIFSRLPLLEAPTLHEIDFSSIQENPRPSRGILEAHLKLPNGDKLVVFAVHFPSQGAPTAFRKLAVTKLLDVISHQAPGTNIMVGGDFNITSKEDYKQKYFTGILSKDFAVSHLVGCQGCAGTIYYPKDKTWSFFDVLLFNKTLSDGGGRWQLDPKSIHIVNSSLYQMRDNGTPSRFGTGGAPTGVSDHWPMYAELKLKGSAQ